MDGAGAARKGLVPFPVSSGMASGSPAHQWCVLLMAFPGEGAQVVYGEPCTWALFRVSGGRECGMYEHSGRSRKEGCWYYICHSSVTWFKVGVSVMESWFE